MDEYEGLALDDFVINDLALVAAGSALLSIGAIVGILLRLLVRRLR